MWFYKLLHTQNRATITLIRLLVGGVFLAEGIQKFLYPDLRGSGRFEAMGFPSPEFWGDFVGLFEIIAGVLLILGLMTRLASLIVFAIMATAIVTIKIPILLGESFGPFVLRDLEYYGFWSMIHEGRTDFSMFLCSIFIMIEGAGKWSFDSLIFKSLEE